MDIKFKFDKILTPKEMKLLKVNDIKDINGVYKFRKEIIINLGAYDIQTKKTDNTIIQMISKIILHETLHYAIFDILNKYYKDGEELVVEYISKQLNTNNFKQTFYLNKNRNIYKGKHTYNK